MANSPTVQIYHRWVDAAGKTQRFGFDLLQPAITDGDMSITNIETAATAVFDELESITDCKFVSAAVVLPLSITVTGGKADPAAGSSARRHAGLLFNGEAGENGRSEVVSFHLPSPLETKIDNTGVRPALNAEDSDVTDLVTAVTGNLRTAGGEDVVSYKGSYIRQRITTPRSRQ